MNERQWDVVLGIVREQLEDYLSADLTDEILEGIREGISDNMELIDQLGGEPTKVNGKMTDGCYLETAELMGIFRRGLGKCMRT